MKQLIFILMFVLLSSVAFGSLTNYNSDNNFLNATYVYHFDETTTTTKSIESIADNNFTVDANCIFNSTNPQVGVSRVKSAGSCTPASPSVSALNGAVSISVWINPSISNKFIVGKWDDGSNNVFRVCLGCGEANKIYLYGSDGTTVAHNYPVYQINLNAWQHLVMVIDPANNYCPMYINGTQKELWDCGALTSLQSVTYPIEAMDVVGQTYQGQMDELILFDYAITNSTIEYLYNTSYPVSTPTASFVSPTLPTDSTNNTQVIINATCSGEENVYLYMDENNPPTNLMLTNSSTGEFTTNVTIDDTYYYFAGCDDGSGGVVGNTSIRTWIYDTTSPNLIINPTNSFTSTNTTLAPFSNSITFNMTFTDNIDLFGFFINISKDGQTYYSVENETLSGTTANFYNITDASSYPFGNFDVVVSVADAHTEQEIDDYQTGLFGNKIVYDTAEGNRIVIQSQGTSTASTAKELDRYTFTFDFTDSPQPNKIFFVECDNVLSYRPNSQFQGHFICWNPDTKRGNWVDWVIEGEEHLTPQVELVETEIGEPTKYKVTYNTNSNILKFKSLGGLNINTQNFIWQNHNLSLSQLYITPSPIAFTEQELIGYVNFTNTLGTDIQYNYIWYRNGTHYANGTVTATQGVLTNLDTITKGETSEGDNWTLSVSANTTGTTTEYFNTTDTAVLGFRVGLCNESDTNIPLLTFRYFDQILGTAIDAQNSYDLAFTTLGSAEANGTFSGNLTDTLCTNINLTQQGLGATVTGQLTLEKDGYATNIWDLTTINPLNATNDPTTIQDLYLIRLNESSTVIFSWLTSNFEPIDGTMEIFECNGDGSTTLVSSTPIVDGEATANIVLINQPYSYRVIYNGVLYTDSEGFSKCHVEPDTTRQYILNVGGGDYSPTVGMYSIGCNITKTGNNTVTMVWGTNPENTDTITGCLYAYRVGASGRVLVYTECANTTQTISATVPISSFSYSLYGRLFQSGYSLQCRDLLEFQATEETADLFSLSGIFAIILLITGLILVFSNEKPMWYPLTGGIALFLAFIFGIVPFGFVPVMSLFSFVCLIIWIGRGGRQE